MHDPQTHQTDQTPHTAVPFFARPRASLVPLFYRRATARWRRLPDFIVIGAQKGGTTALFAYLLQHPQVGRPWKKELNFFSRHYRRGEPWYRARFPLRREMIGGEILGEASPSYMPFPAAPARMREVVPRAKLIALLRDPTERAISHYFHSVRHGMERRPILQAFSATADWLRATLTSRDTADVRPAPWPLRADPWLSYLYRGVYVDHLRRYHRYFGRDQLLIVRSEDLRTRRFETLARVFDFLGIDPTHRPGDVRPRRVGTNKQAVPGEVYELLRGYYRPHNERLYEYLGRDFGWT
jgi:hypothetical protein